MSSELARVEARLAEAMEGGDSAAAEPLLHDDFVLTSSLGSGLNVDKAGDVQAEQFGDVAVVVWRLDWRARWGDDDLSGRYLVSDVWLREAGSWRVRWRSWARLNAEFPVEELRR